MKLAEVRKDRGMSQALLAGQARVAPNLLGYAERGRFHLSAGQASRIAAVLGVNPGDVEELRKRVEDEPS